MNDDNDRKYPAIIIIIILVITIIIKIIVNIPDVDIGNCYGPIMPSLLTLNSTKSRK